MNESKELKEARKILQDMSSSEEERYLAEQREKWIMDKNAIRAAGYDKGVKQGIKQGIQRGIKQGIKQGMQQGMQQGIKQGMQQEKLEIAKKLKKRKESIETIKEITGLTKEKIEEL